MRMKQADTLTHLPDRLRESIAVVPSIWPLEVGNVLVAERKKCLSKADSARFVSLLAGLPIRIEQEPPERMLGKILALAREHQISSYDASYLVFRSRNEEGAPLSRPRTTAW